MSWYFRTRKTDGTFDRLHDELRGDQSESMDWVYDYLGYLVPAWPTA